MGYYVKIEKDKVVDAIIADKDFIDSKVIDGTWIEASKTDKNGKRAFIGYTYDKDSKTFIPPKTYDSWVLDVEYKWKAPVEKPALKSNEVVCWDEANTKWKVLDTSGTTLNEVINKDIKVSK